MVLLSLSMQSSFRSIFFCNPFFAIWFDGERVVDVKLIKSKKISIQPKEKFDKLLEIPSNSEAFSKFTDERNL